jgi:hypothetical protein
MTNHDLDGVLAALNHHQQRATYSAVADLLAQTPRLLMHKRPRAPENSWIVSKTTGLPTGYADTDLHPQLTANDTVLTTREDLASWLANHEALAAT